MDLVIRGFLDKPTLKKWVGKLLHSPDFSKLIIFKKGNCVCRNCGTKQEIMQNEKYLSFLCKCGFRIYYPPTKAGVIITKFISRADYDKKHKKQ